MKIILMICMLSLASCTTTLGLQQNVSEDLFDCGKPDIPKNVITDFKTSKFILQQNAALDNCIEDNKALKEILNDRIIRSNTISKDLE